MLRWRRAGKPDHIAATLLLGAITMEYWFWTFFADYRNTSSVIFLALTECLRLAALVSLFRWTGGKSPLRKAYNFFMVKFFLCDFLVAMTSRASLWERLQIFHPLYLWPLFILSVFQFAIIAIYIAKYRDQNV